MPQRDQNRFREGSQQQDHGQRRQRQPEQFEEYGASQYGDQYDEDDRNQRSGYANDRMSNDRLYSDRDRGLSGGGYDPLGDYDRADSRRTTYMAVPDDQHGRAFGSGNDYDRSGGSDRWRSEDSGYGYSGSGQRGSSASYGRNADERYRSGRNYDRNERGFFEKAGDEVASWFGDDEAQRRRHDDHRGRGPANYTRSNERLHEDACERLSHDWRVDASDITVTAEDNEITLEGTVDSREAKRHAEDCVHDISGVKHVQNNLRIARNDSHGADRQTGTLDNETS